MRILPTSQKVTLDQFSANHPDNFEDISLATPDQQFAALVALIEEDDAHSPTPFTGTPPWSETSPQEEWITDHDLASEYIVRADIEAQYDRNQLRGIIEDAPTSDIPEWDWENDDQYFGLGVPPGAPAIDQPFETGHTQNVKPDSSLHRGEFAWSGKPVFARVARHENAFASYNAGTSRGHMVPVEKYDPPYFLRTNQARDLLLAEIKRRGIHNVTVADVPAVPFNEQIRVVDPTTILPEGHIGPEGVLP